MGEGAESVKAQIKWMSPKDDKAFVPGGIAMIGGEILDKLPRPTARYCLLKATSLLVAGESEFWHQQTTANSTVYTWKDAYLWRNLSLPFSMQTEVFDDGDFEYRYDLSRISYMDALTNVVIGAKFATNELGDVSWLLDGTNTVTSIRFHRLSEFDWDGDGRANEIDPDPYTNNGDCHGQGEGWVLASFTNSTEIISAGGYTNWVASVVENDTGGWWYSFTITANSFDATGHALGADDIYWSSSDKWPDDPEIKVEGPFDASVVASSFDWNNGTGQRFYQIGLAHSELIERLLMYGVTGCNGVDIPHSSVLGVASGGAKFEIRKSSVGRDAMNGENEL